MKLERKNRTIGIVGTGMIACSMAVLTSYHGFETVVFTRSDGSRRRCLDNIEAFIKNIIMETGAFMQYPINAKNYRLVKKFRRMPITRQN